MDVKIKHTPGDYFNAITTGILLGCVFAIFPGIVVGLFLVWVTGSPETWPIIAGVGVSAILGFLGGYMGSLNRGDKKKMKKAIRGY